jgi:enoyl-CoA hydratase
MKEYKTFTLQQTGAVVTVTFVPPVPRTGGNPSWELGSLFNELREDNSVRVIVLTGSGGSFNIPIPVDMYGENPGRHKDPARAWHTFTGILRCHQGMVEIEKPIIAKVNGDAVGFGSSLAFASDFIIAREDAMFMDHHMSGTFMGNYNGERRLGGHHEASVPGDGGATFVPLHMSPCKAKEYLMLAEPYTAAELARMGAINYAVPAAELDAKVDDIVKRLLQRGAYALARSKRLINRRVAEQVNLTLDASVGYEIVCQMQPHDIEKLG